MASSFDLIGRASPRQWLTRFTRSAFRMSLGAALLAGALGTPVRTLAQVASPLPPAAKANEVSPKIAPGLVKPAAPSGFNGPLANFAAPLADRGITFHILALNFSEVNPSVGLQRGRAANSLYLIEGVDADLSKLWGLPGLSLHYENVFFPATENINIAPQIGDTMLGYQPPFTPRIARLSRATAEQVFAGGKLDIEAGITHPAYYYALFNCEQINTCFQDVLYVQGGYTSYKFAVPGGNITYRVTPTLYAQAGAFAVQPSANQFIGYDFPDERYNGVLGMAEIGAKTHFSEEPYPYTISLTGYANSAPHTDFNAATALGGPNRTKQGTQGLVLLGDKIVWRRDHGLYPDDPAPTALRIYGSVGTALDSTQPISTQIWVGATLIAPFANRPADRFGVKFAYERLNTNYAQYLTAANLVSGGPGFASAYNANKFVFEANAHLQLPLGMAFEPAIQYAVHPNSFFNPLTPVKARDGVYLGGTYVIPVGVILGLAAAS